jgi:hypothetical protein
MFSSAHQNAAHLPHSLQPTAIDFGDTISFVTSEAQASQDGCKSHLRHIFR